MAREFSLLVIRERGDSQLRLIQCCLDERGKPRLPGFSLELPGLLQGQKVEPIPGAEATSGELLREVKVNDGVA